MKEVHKTSAVLVYWTIAAVAYGSAECIHGDIRLTDEQATATNRTGKVEVCVSGRWTAVCNTGGWHSNTLRGISKSTKVACRQLGYKEEGATFTVTPGSNTKPGLRQNVCSGSELQLIDCPAIGSTAKCVNGVSLTCQLATCDTTIRLRGGSTATEGRVELCRDGQWGTVCDDSWDRNDASVACRQLGLSDLNAMAIPSAHFGPGSGRIYLSNLQCTGSEATLTDCTFSSQHQCSHNQDTSVICLDCSNEDILLYTSETNTVEFCDSKMCNEACQEEYGVSQLGAYFCVSGELTHFLMNGSQLYECPISGVGALLICELTTQKLANNCQQVLQDIELQASSSSITVTWESTDNVQNVGSNSTYNVTCQVENSHLHLSIVVDAATSEVTVENLPHSTTYECCVTLHIGRYSTRACGNTATPADTTATATTGGGAVIPLGVLVAVLVLLLVLVTGACLYLLIMRVKNNGKNEPPSRRNQPQAHHLENPEYTTRSKPPTPPLPYSTTHPLTPAAPPHTLTSPPLPSKGTELTEFDCTYSTADAPTNTDHTYNKLHERPTKKPENTAKKPFKEVPLPAREGSTEEGVGGAEYSVLDRPEAGLVYAMVDKKTKKKAKKKKGNTAEMAMEEAPLPAREEDTEERLEGSEYSAINRPDLVYAVVDKKAKKKNKQVKIVQAYEVPQESSFLQKRVLWSLGWSVLCTQTYIKDVYAEKNNT